LGCEKRGRGLGEWAAVAVWGKKRDLRVVTSHGSEHRATLIKTVAECYIFQSFFVHFKALFFQVILGPLGCVL
jgi:membrane protein required for beta-lactamase induction